jgi:NAD(P)-dependent dehydrogenase (short-subunit alcohol dehydrogenase family)
MTDTLIYTCSGTDPAEARRVLAEVVDEMHRRDYLVMRAGAEFWTGPALHLTIESVDRLDRDGYRALAHLLKWGRMFGITGVARGGDGTLASFGGNTVIQGLLMTGAPLRYEPTVFNRHAPRFHTSPAA